MISMKKYLAILCILLVAIPFVVADEESDDEESDGMVIEKGQFPVGCLVRAYDWSLDDL